MLKKGWFIVRRIKDMRVVNGRREWLVAWDGTDDAGQAYADSWQPTGNISEPARRAYTEDVVMRRARVIEVDTRPLDSLVQRRMAQAMVKETSASFGKVHEAEIVELLLGDLARHFLEVQAERFGLEIGSTYDASDKCTTCEVILDVPADIGDFCEFTNFMPERSGIKNIRYRCGRAQDTTVVVVGVIYLRFTDNRHTPGCVTFECEYHTAVINGATGELVPPHLGEDSASPLKETEYKRDLYMHVRSLLPENHALARAGWKTLPRHVAQLAVPVGFN